MDPDADLLCLCLHSAALPYAIVFLSHLLVVTRGLDSSRKTQEPSTGHKIRELHFASVRVLPFSASIKHWLWFGDWLQTPYIAEVDLELLILLLPPKCWDYKCEPSHLVCAVLGQDPGTPAFQAGTPPVYIPTPWLPVIHSLFFLPFCSLLL